MYTIYYIHEVGFLIREQEKKKQKVSRKKKVEEKQIQKRKNSLTRKKTGLPPATSSLQNSYLPQYQRHLLDTMFSLLTIVSLRKYVESH